MTEAAGAKHRSFWQRWKPTGLLAWLAIYALIAVLFRSYAQPLIVMSVMPFAFIGAVIGHVLLGHALSSASSRWLVSC